MADLQVGTEIFNYPDPGTEPGWGADATGWATAVTELLSSLAGPGTINETQSTIDNNISVDEQVAGLIFNSALTQSAIVIYRIHRDTDAISPMTEMGQLDILLDNGTWKMTRTILSGEPAGITLDVDPTGQIIYQSSNLAGANYNGFIKFKTIGIIS